MGFARFLKKAIIPGYHDYTTLKKMRQYGIVNGWKKQIKEDFIEDAPIISHVYTAGRNDGYISGKKEGYAQASDEYAYKLLRQAKKFEYEKNNFKTTLVEYEQLLAEYEKYIAAQEKNIDQLSKEKLSLLRKVKEQYNELRKFRNGELPEETESI